MIGVQQTNMVQLTQFTTRVLQSLTPQELQPAFKVIAAMSVADCKRNIAEQHAPDGTPYIPLAHGRPGGVGSPIPLKDTGLLINSIQGRATPTDVIVSSNMAYAGVHQFGAVLTPKRAKFLCIPITKMARMAGSPRRFPGKLSPRVNKAKTKGVLIERIGSIDVVHYVMVRSVVVPARPFLGFSPKLITRIGKFLNDWASKQIYHSERKTNA